MKNTINVDLSQEEDFIFKIDFGDAGIIFSDEPEPLGKNEGPAPSQLLAASVANCLAASLLFALRKKKINPDNISASATSNMERVNNRWRMKKISVDIFLSGEMDNNLKQEALSAFEDFCIVTQSVKEGIDVEVNVVDK